MEDLPGALLLDGLLQAFLLGTLVSQVVKYWSDYRDDSWRKRAFVAVVIVLSILQTALEDYKVWRTTVSDKRWSTSPIEWSDLFLNGCICSLCEGFYIRRCWKLTNKNPWVIFPLSTLSALTMAANIYLAVATGIAFRSLEATDNVCDLKSSWQAMKQCFTDSCSKSFPSSIDDCHLFHLDIWISSPGHHCHLNIDIITLALSDWYS